VQLVEQHSHVASQAMSGLTALPSGEHVSMAAAAARVRDGNDRDLASSGEAEHG